MKQKARLLAALLGLVCSLGASPAQAFCRTHGCNTADPEQGCQADASGCSTTGPVLHWASSCISFDVQKDGSDLRGISYEAARAAITAGFEEWLNADCSGAAPSLEVRDFGAVECRDPEYNQDAGNANVFMFRDEIWPYENADDTLALTTLIYNADNGEIYDADVEINTFQSNIAIASGAPRGIDFASVITHEIGHFLGLSHSRVDGSTMLPSYAPGNTEMASIEADDVAGICEVLAPERPLRGTSCEPRHGFASTCAVPESGCQGSPGRVGGSGALVVALLGLGLRLRRRPLRREARRP